MRIAAAEFVLFAAEVKPFVEGPPLVAWIVVVVEAMFDVAIREEVARLLEINTELVKLVKIKVEENTVLLVREEGVRRLVRSIEVAKYEDGIDVVNPFEMLAVDDEKIVPLGVVVAELLIGLVSDTEEVKVVETVVNKVVVESIVEMIVFELTNKLVAKLVEIDGVV